MVAFSAFVTGAHGFIGRHLSLELSRQGALVTGVGHGAWAPTDSAQWGIRQWLNGTVDGANLEMARNLSGTPEVVYHLAGGSSVGASLANPREDFYRTVTTTAELMEWMRLHAPDTLAVLVSSAAVYGNGHDGAISEHAELVPYSPYGVHKRLMEEIGRSYTVNYGLKVIVVRLFSVYGVHLRKQLLWDLCSKLALGSDRVLLGGSGSELRDWTSIHDVVSCLIGLSCQGLESFDVFNVASGLGTSVRDIAQLVCSSWQACGGQAASPLFSGESRPGDPMALVADCSKLMRYGLACQQPLQESLDAYVRWYFATSMMDS